MLTVWPSPFCPLTIAVTSTKVSFATKFRMHRSYLEEWPVCAWRSNLSAKERGRAARRRILLMAKPMRTILATAMSINLQMKDLENETHRERFKI